MSWSNAYIGTPWQDLGRSAEGCDCWGLAWLVFACELGIELPSYAEHYSSAEEQREIAGLIMAASFEPTWIRVAPQKARPFDIAVFRRGRWDSHIGIIVQPGTMLHMAREDCAQHARLNQGEWRTRLSGIWRHNDLIGT